MAHGIVNSLKMRRDLRRGIDRLAKNFIHESVFRVPLFCPLASRNLSWREMEASGMEKGGKCFFNSMRHLLWTLTGAGLLIGGMSIYRLRNDLTEKLVVNYTPKVKEQFGEIFKIIAGISAGSFLFFNVGIFRKATYPLLLKLASSKTNPGIFAPLVESNIWKLAITLAGSYYYLNGSSNQFKNKWENVVLSGCCGMLLGSFFSGLLLSRYRLRFRSVGGLGIIGGFVGYNSIKGLKEDGEKRMLLDANRAFYTPGVLLVPVIISFTLSMMYLSGIFFPYGMAFAQGNFTGGFFGGILYRKYVEPSERNLDDFVKQTCMEYHPSILSYGS